MAAMTYVLAIANQKGGVAKTTSTKNIAHALAQKGAKVLVVDADPQGDLTDYFGYDPDELDEKEATLYFSLLGDKPISGIILGENPALIPSSIALADAEPELISDTYRSAPTVLREKLAEVQDRYDFVLIDCQPSLSLVTVNVLATANAVLIPIKTDKLSFRGFHRLLASIDKTRQRLNPDLTIFGVLPTIHNPRANHDRATLERMQAELDNRGIRLFPPVNRSTTFDQGMDHQEATIVFAPNTPGAAVYVAVADELLSHHMPKAPAYA